MTNIKIDDVEISVADGIDIEVVGKKITISPKTPQFVSYWPVDTTTFSGTQTTWTISGASN